VASEILSLECIHPAEVAHVLRIAASKCRNAGEMEREAPAATTVWDGLAEVLENAANAAERHLRDAGLS
jgi:hypothetical protein